ncbi:50S ribosomal protein L9 [Candidatus Palauibacter polyketidifaciens]|uniref:50S ribosomal protein L9 n=1 Tax=Candidatus Palauibacter polyketidifaciens TaxID=3056740 RepID=UPI002390FD48|nr:50S ribosomal protein L9 [Candidatus Palauibacter polyketidifaciens]MDE2721445.1 50S ribosomal protein L9 [Candidatus Palauibacter polyketidifaciens]
MVEVILRKDVADLGLAGEMVNVRPGYARNYLIPQGIALAATEGNRRRFEEERRQIEQSAEREREAAQELAGELEGRAVSFVRRASEGGRLFGSVTAADIADELEKEGVAVDRRAIRLEDPIKDLGEHEVPVRVHMDIEPTLKVSVVAEE